MSELTCGKHSTSSMLLKAIVNQIANEKENGNEFAKVEINIIGFALNVHPLAIKSAARLVHRGREHVW